MDNKTKEDIREMDIKREALCELHGYPITLPGKTKYKKSSHEKTSGPDIEVGTQVVLAVNKRQDRVGYYLAVLVDWYEPEYHGWWSDETNLFFIVLDRSNEKIEDLRGRIVCATRRGRWYGNALTISSWDISTFKKV